MPDDPCLFDNPCLAEAMRAYMLETAPVLALYLDADDKISGANALARRVMGSEAMGCPLAERIVDFTGSIDLEALFRQEGVIHSITLHTASGMPETVGFRFFPHSDGTLALGSLDWQEQQRLRDEALMMNRELNDLARQLYQANAELRELNELKNRFIGMAAHDLRKPVGVIMTYSEFVLDEAGDRLDDEARGFVRASLAAAVGMKRLIDNFLDVSVIEAGHFRLERSRTSIAEIIAGMWPLVSLVAARKRVELLTEVGEDARSLAVDAAKIQQVLVNLVSNAVEHSSSGQCVWLTACEQDAELVFAVRDEGCGIAIENQERLFAPFVRVGTRKTAHERHVGLGLAVARLIVEAHGGHIWVESRPGAGTTFRFAIPIQE